MKNLLTTILVFLPLFSFSQVITDGLVGYWPFNGNALDESGNGNNGTVNGATPTTDRFGDAGRAYFFGGIDDNINIPTLTSINNDQNQFAISAWAKISDYKDGSFPIIVSKWKHRINREFALGYHDRRDVIYGHVFDERDDSNQVSISSFQPGLNEWFHVLLSYDGASENIYINGVLSSSVDATEDYYPSSVPIMFGNTQSLSNDWEGAVDDVRIYNRVLTESEIQQIYSVEAFETPPYVICGNIYCDGGKVGIGTQTVPSEYLLAVNGKAIMEEVKVQLQINWPDYVFDKEYPIKSLSELDQFVKEKKHLPELPSAMEVKEHGIYLGEMDAKLLQKIEELTLYTIGQQKELEQQATQINLLIEQNKVLLQEIQTLKN